MSDRTVFCIKLQKELPGLPKPPFKNDLGKQIYEQVSAEAWEQWRKDSPKYINTYRIVLATPEGQAQMNDLCSKYFGLKEGELPQTAFTPADQK